MHLIAEGQTSPRAEGDVEILNIGGSLAFNGERFLELHILTKYFVGRLTAVDAFYSIHKVAVFNAEQLILGITALRYVESLWLKGK